MIGNIIGEEIDGYVSDQINFRQRIQGSGRDNIDGSLKRDNKILSFLNTRNTWIKLASGVGIEQEEGIQRVKDVLSKENYTTEVINDQGNPQITNIAETNLDSLSGDALASSFVLFNTTQKLDKDSSLSDNYIRRSGVINNSKWIDSFDKTYGGMGYSDQGLVPVPGITNVSVECVNRGSIKKAVVTLKAYNKFQFGIIELLYLRLGYTMLLEYGWDRYLNGFNETTNELDIANVGSTVIEDKWFSNPNPDPDDILSTIENYRGRYKGNYDGFFGKVYNFEWNLNSDLTYDITINLITVGSVITSLTTKSPSVLTEDELLRVKLQIKAQQTGQNVTEVTNEYQEALADDTNIDLPNVGNNTISIFLSKQIMEGTTPEYIVGGKTKDRVRVVLSNIKRTYNTKNGGQKDIKDLEGFEVKNDVYYHLGSFLQTFFKKVNHYIVNTEDEENAIPQLRYVGGNLICNYEKNLIPLDPTICIFNPVFEEDIIENNFKITGRKVSTYDILSELDMRRYVTEDDGVFYGNLENLYMNINFLLNILDQNVDNENNLSVFQFLKNLCDGINRSMAGVTKLEPVIKNDNIVTIIEQNTPKGYDIIKPKKTNKKDAVEFELIGYNEDKSNFVKDFKFITKITPDLGNIISIGAAATNSDTKSIEALPFSKWNKGLKNIYQSKLLSYNDNLDENTPNMEEKAKESFLNNTFIQRNYTSISNREELYDENTGYNLINFFWKCEGRSINLNYQGYGLLVRPITIAENSNRPYTEGANEERDNVNYAGDNYFTKRELLEKYYNSNQELRDTITEVYAGIITLSNLGISKETEKVDSSYKTYLAFAFGGTKSEFGYDKYEYKGKEYTNYNVLGSTPVDPSQAKWWGLNKSFIKSGKSVFRRYQSNRNRLEFIDQGVVSNSVGFIPLNLQMTVEGISGVKIYNKLNIDQRFLPKNYPNSLSFITMKVNHNLQDNIWETNYECFSIPKSDKVAEGIKIVSPPKNLINEPTPNAPTETVEGTGPRRYSVLKPSSPTGLIYNTNLNLNPTNEKTRIFLHHTEGGGTISGVIKNWRLNGRRDTISTQYIIDRDGNYEKLFNDEYWSTHSSINNDKYESRTIGIELINIGPLKKTSNGKFQSVLYPNRVETVEGWGGVSPTVDMFKMATRSQKGSYNDFEQDLMDPDRDGYYNSPYRGNTYFQSYTTAQLKTLLRILLELYKKYPNINSGGRGTELPNGDGNLLTTRFGSYKNYVELERIDAFGRVMENMFPVNTGGAATTYIRTQGGSNIIPISPDSITGTPGLYTHNSTSTNKTDVAPLPELIDMVKVLAYKVNNPTLPGRF